jgi:hypothetical protein
MEKIKCACGYVVLTALVLAVCGWIVGIFNPQLGAAVDVAAFVVFAVFGTMYIILAIMDGGL